MKAIQFYTTGGPEVLTLNDVPQPEPQAGEVLVKVAYAGINFADTMQRQGSYPLLLELPAIPGNEIAGTVVAHGEGVTTPPVGTRVMAMKVGGSYAEYATIPAEQAIPVPENVQLDQATALLVQGLTAYGLLHSTAQVQSGQSVLVMAAAGGVGSMLIQLAKIADLHPIVAAAGSAEKLARAKSLGADATVNYRETDWSEQVLAATDGQGVNVVMETVGGEIGSQSFGTIATGGQIVVYGAASGELPRLSEQLIHKQGTLKGYTLYNDMGLLQSALPHMLGWLAEGRIQVDTQVFPLAEAAAAHHAIESRATQGKVVLVVEG